LLGYPDINLPRCQQWQNVTATNENFSSWAANAITNNLTVNADSPITFSACLVVKDDNLILPEWLAYHYEFMPLRRLIILVDSNSVTSPQHIIDKHQRHTDLNITTWTDQDILHKATRRAHKKYNFNPNATAEEKHRLFIDIKQPLFYKLCAKKLQEEVSYDSSSVWTMFVDTDEYIAFNNFQDTSQYDDSAHDNFRQLNLTHRYPETVASFLQHNQDRLEQNLNYSYCMYLPRVQHAAIEVNPTFPHGFHEKHFSTVQYPVHASAADSKLLGKTLVDVSKINTNVIGNPHRINLGECYGAEQGRFADPSKALFRVHHHLGSVSDFLSRPGDPSRSLKIFQKRNATGAKGWSSSNNWHHDYSTRSMHWWLISFFNRFGSDKAMALTTKLREQAIKENAYQARTRTSK
jgi:hypothetical protein